MKKRILLLLTALLAVSAFADEYVQGYLRRDGTYVPGYNRTAPDGNPYNNYSTQGNTNPYTGRPGTVNPLHLPPAATVDSSIPRGADTRLPLLVRPAQQCGYTSNGQYICR
ncbi:MAG: hypothetical protein JWR07_1949 [Nevskia sp.]|nr:hypothetical protein [Nevskia sp.]